MRNFKICFILIGLLATNGYTKNSDFYSMGREILGDMVSIESTEAKGLASDVSEYAASVLQLHACRSSKQQTDRALCFLRNRVEQGSPCLAQLYLVSIHCLH